MIGFNSIIMDQLPSTRITYKMRISKVKYILKESAFKEDMKSKEEHGDTYCELDREEAMFMSNLKRGSIKYKGKLAFNFFHCVRVGYYAYKCLDKKKNEHGTKNTYRMLQKEKLFEKKGFYA